MSESTGSQKQGMAITPQPLRCIREMEQAGIKAGLPLMQRAGQAIADFVQRVIPPTGLILILAGPGNNGGDALVAASTLRQSGYQIHVWMPVTTSLPPDAAQAFQAWRDNGGEVSSTFPTEKPILVVDGLFGIGLSRQLGSPWQEAIDTVNAWSVPILAIDMPSGLEADTGMHLGRPIRATWTLALIAPTQAVYSQSGTPFAGEVLVDQLGLPISQSPTTL